MSIFVGYPPDVVLQEIAMGRMYFEKVVQRLRAGQSHFCLKEVLPLTILQLSLQYQALLQEGAFL